MAQRTSLAMVRTGPPPKSDMVSYGDVELRDNEMFWNDIVVADVANGRLVARGTVLYRNFFLGGS